MNRTNVAKLLRAVAVIIDIVAPLVAIFVQFPIWVDRSSGATVSGLAVLLLVIAAIPLKNKIMQWLKSPSIPVLWAVLFFASVIIVKILNEVIVIAFVGMVANLIGAAIDAIALFVDRR